MKKDIFFKRGEPYSPDFISTLLGSFEKDPLVFRDYSKACFKQEYTLTAQEIQEAVRNNVPVIHLRHDNEKFYDVLTPYTGKVQLCGLEELLYQMFGIMGLMDTFPIRYLVEEENIVRVVAPRRGSQKEFSSQSPYNDLDWHVDAAYRPMDDKNDLSPLPDYLFFGIIHKGYQALPMKFIGLEDILKQLSYEEIAEGLKPQFAVSSTDSFSQKVEKQHIPLLVKNSDGRFYSRITLQNAKPLTHKAVEFLEKIRKITNLQNIQQTISVNPGDIVILNNKMVLHKRDCFEPKWDGRDRYFIRVYAVKDLGRGIQKDLSERWVWI